MHTTTATVDDKPELFPSERPGRRNGNIVDSVRNAVLRRVRKAVFGILDLHTEFEVLD
jgi:hypothetical protein